MPIRLRWDPYFLAIARVVAQRSLDPSTKVGAVITDTNHRIVSTGYNGFPCGIEDSRARWEDRATKMRYAVHAERNAIDAAAAMGVSTWGGTLYLHPFAPCFECAKDIIQAGIQRVVHPTLPEHLKERWEGELMEARALLLERRIQIEALDVPTVDYHVQYLAGHVNFLLKYLRDLGHIEGDSFAFPDGDTWTVPE